MSALGAFSGDRHPSPPRPVRGGPELRRADADEGGERTCWQLVTDSTSMLRLTPRQARGAQQLSAHPALCTRGRVCGRPCTALGSGMIMISKGGTSRARSTAWLRGKHNFDFDDCDVDIFR